MKFSALSLPLLVAFSISVQAQAKNDLEKSGLAGRVKSVEYGRIEYTLKDGRSVEGRRVLNGKITFNEQGNKAEGVAYGRAAR